MGYSEWMINEWMINEISLIAGNRSDHDDDESGMITPRTTEWFSSLQPIFLQLKFIYFI